MRRWLVLCCLFLVAASGRELRLLRVADEAFRDKVFDFAAGQYQQFLKQFPDSENIPEVRHRLAQCQIGQGKWQEAIATLEQGAASASATDFMTRFWLAEALAFGGEFSLAEDHYRAVVDQGATTEAAPAAYGLAYVRFKQGDYDSAAEALNALNPSTLPPQTSAQVSLLRGQIAIAQNDFAAADQILQSLREQQANTHWGYRALRLQAELAAHQQQWDPAREWYRLVIASYQDNPNALVDAQLAAEAWMGLGWIAWERQEFEQAIDPFSRALSLATQPWLKREAMVKLGESYVRSGKLAQGVARLKDFVSTHRDDFLAEEVQMAIGDLFYEASDFGAARAEYKELVARYPRSRLSARAGFQAGWCAIEQERFADALADFEQAFATASQTDHPAASDELAAEALFKVADTHFQMDALAKAVNTYQRLISSYPKSDYIERAYFQLGHVYNRMENHEAAIAVLEDLVNQYPGGALAAPSLFQIAQIQIDVGQETSARSTLQRVARMFPDEVDRARLGIGESFYREGQYHEAIQTFGELIDNASNLELAQQAMVDRGWCYQALGEEEQALEGFTAFLEAHPASPLAASVQFWVGDHYTLEKNHLKAQEHYQSIHLNYPDSEYADDGLYFAALAAYARQDYKNAIDLQETLIKGYPNSEFRCKARLVQGDAFTEMNEFEDAVLVFESLLKEFPDCELTCDAMGRRGDCYYTLESYDKAIAAFREALGCARDAAPATRNQIQYKLGRSYEKDGQLEEALETFNRVFYETVASPDTSLPPERDWFSKAALAAGDIRERQEQWREAISVYTRLGEMCPHLREMLDAEIRRIRVEHFILF